MGFKVPVLFLVEGGDRSGIMDSTLEAQLAFAVGEGFCAPHPEPGGLFPGRGVHLRGVICG